MQKQFLSANKENYWKNPPNLYDMIDKPKCLCVSPLRAKRKNEIAESSIIGDALEKILKNLLIVDESESKRHQ